MLSGALQCSSNHNIFKSSVFPAALCYLLSLSPLLIHQVMESRIRWGKHDAPYSVCTGTCLALTEGQSWKLKISPLWKSVCLYMKGSLLSSSSWRLFFMDLKGNLVLKPCSWCISLVSRWGVCDVDNIKIRSGDMRWTGGVGERVNCSHNWFQSGESC